MKRFFALLMTFVLLFSLTACGNTSNTDTDTKDNAAENSGGMQVDENLLTVDITLPASFFEDQTEEEIQAAAKENNVKKCVINEDGTVTYTMTKKAHKELLDDLKAECDKSVQNLLEGEDKVASFVSIDYNDNLSKFDVYVDASIYATLDNMYALGFYIVGAYYQAFAGIDLDEVDVIVNFIDNETKEVLHTASYKDYMDNTNE